MSNPAIDNRDTRTNFTERPLLSVVCPCYNESSCIDLFVAAVSEHIPADVRYEMVFVDDGSTDDTLKIVKDISARRPEVRYVSFSRNFGKESALAAGLRKARGDLVVTMDVDLQDPPDLLPIMLAGIRAGYDCVATRRRTRQGEPALRSFFARCFYVIMRHCSDVVLVDGARDFRMMTRPVVEAVLAMPEVNRFTKGIYQWVGFKTQWLEFENSERAASETKWSIWKLFAYAVNGILAFTTLPLQLAAWCGVLACLGSFVSLVWIYVKALVFGNPVAGWPSMVCIIIFLGGFQLFGIGIVGIYLAKVYLEVKRRPLYFIKEEF